MLGASCRGRISQGWKVASSQFQGFPTGGWFFHLCGTKRLLRTSGMLQDPVRGPSKGIVMGCDAAAEEGPFGAKQWEYSQRNSRLPNTLRVHLRQPKRSPGSSGYPMDPISHITAPFWVPYPGNWANPAAIPDAIPDLSIKGRGAERGTPAKDADQAAKWECDSSPPFTAPGWNSAGSAMDTWIHPALKGSCWKRHNSSS